MGCDIHVLTEAYNKKIGWYNTDNWRINPYFGENKYEEKMVIQPIYTDRHYELFSLLADVRNYHDNIKCICKPKGLPDDMSEISKEYADNWGAGAHSHSWFTLKELYDYWLKMPKTAKRTWEVEYNPLDSFIKNLIERFCDVFCVLWINDYKTDERLKQEIEKKGDNFRVIFFFDN